MTCVLFADPARLQEAREASTCKGCVYEVRQLIPPGLAGIGAPVKMRCAGGNVHGTRCRRYLERECPSLLR